jgi:DUF971 family protein
MEIVIMSSTAALSPVWPTALKVDAAKRVLTISFEGGETFAIAAELLRTQSPSAEVQGHSPDQKITVAGKRNVTIRDVVPVGHYAVRIVFDDGHDTGIFTWAYLHELGTNGPEFWQSYLQECEAQGLIRG